MVDLVGVENGLVRQAVAPIASAKSQISTYLSALESPIEELNHSVVRLAVNRAWRQAWVNSATVTQANVVDFVPRWTLRQARIIFGSAKPSAVRAQSDHIKKTLLRHRVGLREAAAVGALTLRAKDVIEDAFRALGDFEVSRYLSSDKGQAYLTAFDRAWRINSAETDQLLQASLSSGVSLEELTSQFEAAAGRAQTSVERLVRTQTQAIAFDTEEMVMDYAGPLLSSVQWMAILDGRLCLRCARLHGQVFDIVDPLRPSIPLHPLCRCSLVPLLNADAGGMDVSDADMADMPAEITFEDWLKAQSDELQISILGQARHTLFKAGYPIEKFVNRLGRIIRVASLPTVGEWLASRKKS